MDSNQRTGKTGGRLSYERQSTRWLVAAVLLLAGLAGVAFCAWHVWQGHDWSYVLLACLFLSGVIPAIREFRLAKKIRLPKDRITSG